MLFRSPRHILDEIRAAAPAGKHLVLENDANQARFVGPGKYNAQWNDDSHHAYHVAATGESDGYYNRKIEDTVTSLGGHKGLYSTSFYSRDEFWARYNGPEYWELKRTYDADGRLADLYDKCVRGQ